MTETHEVEAGEKSLDELLHLLEAGDRIIVKTEFLGSMHEVTLRRDETTYYCDTPTRLHKHSSKEEMRTCLKRQGYAVVEEA